MGMYTLRLGRWRKRGDREILDVINAASPDLLWIGLGVPKQEKWRAGHHRGLMIGVGAAFDYYVGNIKRVPGWMQKANLEWLYRLM